MGRPPFWHESGEGERQNGPWIGKETMAQCTVHEVFCFTLMLHKVNRHGHCIIHSSTRKHPMVLGHSCAIFEGEMSQWMPPIECFFHPRQWSCMIKHWRLYAKLSNCLVYKSYENECCKIHCLTRIYEIFLLQRMIQNQTMMMRKTSLMNLPYSRWMPKNLYKPV